MKKQHYQNIVYLLVEESRQTLCGGLGGGVCHLDLQLGLVGQAVAEEGGRAPAHDAAARAGTCVQLVLRPEPRHRHNYRDVKCWCWCWPPAAAASAQVYYYCECPLMAAAPCTSRHSASSNVAQNKSQYLG